MDNNIMHRFKGEKSDDEIELYVFLKNHRTILNLKVVESPKEHIKLISDVEIFLRKNDIKWIEFPVDNPIIPVNSICYKNKYNNNNAVCHIEDFNKFYFSNIKKIIQIKHIKFNKNKVDNKGWVIVQSSQKYKDRIYNDIIEDLESLSKIN